MSPIILLLLGFALLFVGGEVLVRAAVSLAFRIKISTFPRRWNLKNTF